MRLVFIVAGSLIGSLFIVTVVTHLLWFAYIILWWRRKRTKMGGFAGAQIRELIKSDPIYDAFASVCGFLLWLWLPVLWLQFVIVRKVRSLWMMH